MCKSKAVIPSDQLLNYIVILKKDVTVKDLKKDLKNDVKDFNKMKSEMNQWALVFHGESKESSTIKAELLNHHDVVSVFSKEEFEKMQLKEKKDDNGQSSRKKVTKQ